MNGQKRIPATPAAATNASPISGTHDGTMGTVSIGTLFGPPVMARLQAASVRTAALSPTATAGDEDLWREVQQAFTINRNLTNLDNGNICPSPRVVTEAMLRRTWEFHEAPAFTYYELHGRQMESVRALLARQFGCDGEEIAIVRNATEALDNVLMGLELQKGDEVVVSSHEYWAMMDALEHRAERDGLVVTRVPIPVPAESLAQLERLFDRAISPRTKLVLVSHPVNLTGQLFPIKRICEMAHARGAEVLVDGAQSFAHVDYKLADLGCDYFGTSLHKWLLAPVGTGMLYIRRDKIPKVRPLFPAPADLRRSIDKFHRFGTQPLAMALAISDALAFHSAIGGRRKEERLRYLTRYWVDRVKGLENVRFLTSFETGMSCGLATFEIIGTDSVQLARHLLDRYRIIVQEMSDARSPEIRGIRITPNLYTTLTELDGFSDAIETIARKGLPKN